MSFLFPSQTITFAAALRDIANGSAKARIAAAHALGDVTDATEKARAAEALINALDDDRFEVRAEAAGSLGNLGESVAASALAPLVKRLGDGTAAVRQNAAIALGSMGHRDAFEPLAEALRDGPADVRFQAATSLAEIDAARAFEPIVAALADGDPQVVAAAALSLGAIGDERAVPQLAPILEHADKGARFDAAYALAELGDATGKEILVGALGDQERAWDAITALAALANARPAVREDVAELLGRALVDKKTPPEATVLAAGTILRLGPASAHHDAARRALQTAAKSRKGHVKSLAEEQLAALTKES